MSLYLDDDSVDRVLIRRLFDGGHEVLTPAAAGTAGHADPVHFMCSIRKGLVLLTHDHEDFTLLHELVLLSGGHHPGIFVIRRDNDPTRTMSPGAIVRAIHKLVTSTLPIPDAVHVLNHWR